VGKEYNDYNSANGGIENQVTPTFYSAPGVLTSQSTVSGVSAGNEFEISNQVPAQITTQTNPGFPSEGINSIVQAEQALAVVGPIYQSPGGILNKAAGNAITTGGGP
jgi:hypothetical protein